MVDPIIEEELRRSRRMKQYDDYQKHLDALDEKDKTEPPAGQIGGRKVKKLESNETNIPPPSP